MDESLIGKYMGSGTQVMMYIKTSPELAKKIQETPSNPFRDRFEVLEEPEKDGLVYLTLFAHYLYESWFGLFKESQKQIQTYEDVAVNWVYYETLAVDASSSIKNLMMLLERTLDEPNAPKRPEAEERALIDNINQLSQVSDFLSLLKGSDVLGVAFVWPWWPRVADCRARDFVQELQQRVLTGRID